MEDIERFVEGFLPASNHNHSRSPEVDPENPLSRSPNEHAGDTGFVAVPPDTGKNQLAISSIPLPHQEVMYFKIVEA